MSSARKAQKAAPKAAVKTARKAPSKPSASNRKLPAKAQAAPADAKGKAAATAAGGRGAAGGGAASHPDEARPAAPKKTSRKGGGSRRDGKSYPPGELLLPGGSQTPEETLYFFRGCVAAEHAVPQEGLQDIVTRRGLGEADQATEDVRRLLVMAVERFASGALDPLLPSRAQARRTFTGVLERVRGRRREIGAFLRGLDLGRTEVSHLDSHAETSLQNLMEWTARIDKMVEEGEEPEQADYNQLHRGVDQLDNTTEALIVDLELTLKRLRDRQS
jgi:hypothetical protein